MIMRRLLIALALLAGLAPRPSSAAPGVAWQPLYTRQGWDGGPALDIRAVGDVMLGRGVAKAAQQQGYGYALAQAKPLLAGDLALGNLESPLTERAAVRSGPYRLPAPPAFAPALRAAGFGALSLTNNHALDSGPAGLRDAAQALAAQGIAPLGAGDGAQAASAAHMITAAGQRVALLAYNQVRDPADQPDEAEGWGRAWLDDDAIAQVRAAARRADHVVVLVHWGQEYQPAPSPAQRDWSARLVAAGADVVLGAHPHVLQPVELIDAGGRRGVVAFSLGNFVFDQDGRADTSHSAVLRVLLDARGVAAVEAAPVAIRRGQVAPAPSGSASAAEALAALRPAEALATAAWRWQGEAAAPISPPAGEGLRPTPTAFSADLRGDGHPLWVTLDSRGIVEVRETASRASKLLWQNESPAWQVRRIATGDADGDGRADLLLALWKPDAQGVLRSYPFLVGYRGGAFRVIWGGSPTPMGLQDVRVGDIDGDGDDEVVLLEGGARPGDTGQRISVLRWDHWMLGVAWRSPLGHYQAIDLRDPDADGALEILAGASAPPAR